MRLGLRSDGTRILQRPFSRLDDDDGKHDAKADQRRVGDNQHGQDTQLSPLGERGIRIAVAGGTGVYRFGLAQPDDGGQEQAEPAVEPGKTAWCARGPSVACKVTGLWDIRSMFPNAGVFGGEWL